MDGPDLFPPPLNKFGLFYFPDLPSMVLRETNPSLPPPPPWKEFRKTYFGAHKWPRETQKDGTPLLPPFSPWGEDEKKKKKKSAPSKSKRKKKKICTINGWLFFSVPFERKILGDLKKTFSVFFPLFPSFQSVKVLSRRPRSFPPFFFFFSLSKSIKNEEKNFFGFFCGCAVFCAPPLFFGVGEVGGTAGNQFPLSPPPPPLLLLLVRNKKILYIFNAITVAPPPFSPPFPPPSPFFFFSWVKSKTPRRKETVRERQTAVAPPFPFPPSYEGFSSSLTTSPPFFPLLECGNLSQDKGGGAFFLICVPPKGTFSLVKSLLELLVIWFPLFVPPSLFSASVEKKKEKYLTFKRLLPPPFSPLSSFPLPPFQIVKWVWED